MENNNLNSVKAFERVLDSIDSCINEGQLNSCADLIDVYAKSYPSDLTYSVLAGALYFKKYLLSKQMKRAAENTNSSNEISKITEIIYN